MERCARLYLGAFVVSLGYGMLAPLVVDLVAAGRSPLMVGLLVGLYPLMKAAGYASCLLRRVRAWPAAPLLLVTAASYATLAFTFAEPVAAAARSLEGFVFGWFLARASLEIAASREHVGRSLSWLNGMSSAGVLCGPLLVACANALGHAQAAFLAAALSCFCAAALQRRSILVPQVSENASAHAPANRPASSWALVLLFASFDFTFGALSVTIPLAFEQGGADALPATATLVSGGFLIFTVLMPAFGRLVDRIRVMPLLVMAVIVIAGIFLLLFTGAAPPGRLTTLMFVEYAAAAAAYSLGLAALGRSAPGLIPAVGVVQSIAMSAGSLVAGRLLATDGTGSVFACLAATYLTCAALLTMSSALERLHGGPGCLPIR